MTPARARVLDETEARMDAEEAAADEQAAAKAAESGPHAAPVEVTVAHPYQVSHAGRVYGPGDTCSVPGDLAERWRHAGYIRP